MQFLETMPVVYFKDALTLLSKVKAKFIAKFAIKAA